MGKNTRLRMLARNGGLAFAVEPDGEAGGAPAQPATPEPAPANNEEPQGEPADLGDAGKKALAAERKRADEAEKAAKAYKTQIEQAADANLTETQRLQKQLEELTVSYKESQLEATRSRVIADAGIPSGLAGFVRGADEAELVASAQALKSAVTEASKPGTPIPDPSQGAHPPLDAVAHAAPGAPRLAAAFEQQLTTRK